ncbi:MAG: transporter [Acidobacteria bacterium]|nr:transporter [Acidobacteriota bacterium]
MRGAFLSFVVAISFTLFCHQPTFAQKETPPIQDNSFLVEEAYNQEKSVVQHINTFTYLADSHDWSYTFTQEWPVGGQRNQFSYTLSSVRPGAFSSQGPGFGDAILNYRYQVLGNGQTRVAFAPRLSMILPSGDSDLGHGYGGAGVQTNLPLSVVLLPKLVSHWNAGTTYVPHARNSAGDRASVWSYNAGQSMIWLAHPRFNVMLETYFLNAQAVAGPGKTEWSKVLLLNPGIRWSYNFSNGLQIVPGLAFPIGVGPSGGEKGVFVYLSFEHPFQKIKD